MDFENGIARLEEIVTSLENGNIRLEDSMELYKEGVELATKLHDTLSAAEEKLKGINLTVEL